MAEIFTIYLALSRKGLLTPELKLEAAAPSGRALQVDRPPPLTPLIACLAPADMQVSSLFTSF